MYVNSSDQRQHVRMVVMMPEEKKFLKRSTIVGEKTRKSSERGRFGGKNGNKYW